MCVVLEQSFLVEREIIFRHAGVKLSMHVNFQWLETSDHDVELQLEFEASKPKRIFNITGDSLRPGF